jgi:transposase InsO family protein
MEGSGSFAYADFISRLIESHEKPDEDVVIAATTAGSTVNVKNKNNALLPPSDKVNAKQEKNSAPGGSGRKANVKNENEPGNSNVNQTDPIRWTGLGDIVTSTDKNDESTIRCFAIETANLLPITFESIQDETQNCEVLGKVKQFISKGWPSHQKQIQDAEVSKYFCHRSSLIVIDGCIFFGDRIVVPSRFRKQILNELHQGHPGIARMKLFARSKVFWPAMDNDITVLVKSCNPCVINSKSPVKCSLRPWPIPKGPWSRVHCDFAGPVDGCFFFIIVDAFSNWPEVYKMSSTTSAKTIDRFEEAFSHQGLCDTIVSDNGPQLVSEEFESFCKANGIEHITTAPYHPQSNGQAERFVDTLKRGLKKLEGEGNVDQVLRKFLLCYRYTPSYALGGKSPFQIMTGREMKTKIDVMKRKEKQNFEGPSKMEKQFNAHHGAKWKQFEIGDFVFIKLHHGMKWAWKPATVLSRVGNVDYDVLAQTPNGERQIKVHANQMKLRYNIIDETSNILLEEFELPQPRNVEVEPEIRAERGRGDLSSQDVEASSSEDEFVEAQEQPDEQPPTPLRRSTRANLGQRPNFYIP